jgi:hypothetical protein
MAKYVIWTGPDIDPVYGGIGAEAQDWETEAESGIDALEYAKRTFAPWQVIVVGPDKRRVADPEIAGGGYGA